MEEQRSGATLRQRSATNMSIKPVMAFHSLVVQHSPFLLKVPDYDYRGREGNARRDKREYAE